MAELITSTSIALVGVAIQLLIMVYAIKFRKRAEKILDAAKKKRQAALTILEFAELWRRNMSEDDRANLAIEWHERLEEANVNLRMDDEL